MFPLQRSVTVDLEGVGEHFQHPWLMHPILHGDGLLEAMIQKGHEKKYEKLRRTKRGQRGKKMSVRWIRRGGEKIISHSKEHTSNKESNDEAKGFFSICLGSWPDFALAFIAYKGQRKFSRSVKLLVDLLECHSWVSWKEVSWLLHPWLNGSKVLTTHRYRFDSAGDRKEYKWSFFSSWGLLAR